MFYELLFLWWFFGSLNLTFAYNVPIDLEQITEASQTDFRLFENPYFIYVDFQTLARKQCDRQTYPHGDCICYWGFNAPPAEQLKKQLSPKEKTIFENYDTADTQIKSAPSLIGAHCRRNLDMETKTIYDGFFKENNEKYKKIHQGHLGSRFGLQKICISSVEKTKLVSNGNRNITYYEITVKTTGNNGMAYDAQVATIKRMASEGFLQLQFNTKMGVLQSLGEIPNENAQFFVIPQIATIPGFDLYEQNTNPSNIEIEDVLVQMDYNSCTGSAGPDPFYFSKNDLKNVAYSYRPTKVNTYYGTLLLPNGTLPYKMYDADQTEAEDILYDEIKYVENQPIKK